MTSTTWLWWIILSALTGSPLLSAIFMLLLIYGLDQNTFRFFPGPVLAYRRWVLKNRLTRTLAINPNEMNARIQLGQLLVDQKKYREAVDVMRPALEGGCSDIALVFNMATACLNSGFHSQGEKLMNLVIAENEQFRLGEPHLVLGRYFLAWKKYSDAVISLEKVVRFRPGTIEARYLLSRCAKGQGDAVREEQLREATWKEYVTAPPFQRKVERRFAWLANPQRPILYATLLIAVSVGAAYALKKSNLNLNSARYPSAYQPTEDDE